MILYFWFTCKNQNDISNTVRVYHTNIMFMCINRMALWIKLQNATYNERYCCNLLYVSRC